ncbi:hypothetical protein JL475_00375 [Streptomyces sp. M2CJ-2]|uniref:hypothetical protein n=1 Tax=Streptomyces sp. M2CJ-2 TaxID=2803948 RepID=UPI00192256FE|nr:hypothetical protein [Streptomyces sp. M2CJ-2]MBL3664501.1 hypothetical protein [Streptomyces sp. M2CJ-2]
MTTRDQCTDETERLRAEVSELQSIIRELWLRVADAGSLMSTSWVRGALEGDTDLSDKDYVRNAFKLPEHLRAELNL